MSHVATINIEVKDLDALGIAAGRIGLELVRGQKEYRWYGQSVGDYPLPAGLTEADLGVCEHAIRIAGTHGGQLRTAGDLVIPVRGTHLSKPNFNGFSRKEYPFESFRRRDILNSARAIGGTP